METTPLERVHPLATLASLTRLLFSFLVFKTKTQMLSVLFWALCLLLDCLNSFSKQFPEFLEAPRQKRVVEFHVCLPSFSPMHAINSCVPVLACIKNSRAHHPWLSMMPVCSGMGSSCLGIPHLFPWLSAPFFPFMGSYNTSKGSLEWGKSLF